MIETRVESKLRGAFFAVQNITFQNFLKIYK